MAEVKKTKKQMSFGMLLGIFGGGFVLLIILGLIAAKAMNSGNNARVETPVTQGQLQPQSPAALQSANPNDAGQAGYENAQAGMQGGDITSYLDAQNQGRGLSAISQQLNVMQSQMTGMQSEFNQGNANMGQQLMKIQQDMILLDQRINAIENALKNSSPNKPMSGKQGADWKRERHVQGKIVADKDILASSNGRTWINDGKNTSLDVGERIGSHKIVSIDDARQRVYVN